MTFQWLFSNIAWHFIQTSTLNAILAIKILPKVAKEMVTGRPQPPPTLPILSLFWQLLEVWFHPDPLPPLVTMSLNMTFFFFDGVPYCCLSCFLCKTLKVFSSIPPIPLTLPPLRLILFAIGVLKHLRIKRSSSNNLSKYFLKSDHNFNIKSFC